MNFSSCSVAQGIRTRVDIASLGVQHLLEIEGTRIQPFVIGSVAIFCMQGGALMNIQ